MCLGMLRFFDQSFDFLRQLPDLTVGVMLQALGILKQAFYSGQQMEIILVLGRGPFSLFLLLHRPGHFNPFIKDQVETRT